MLKIPMVAIAAIMLMLFACSEPTADQLKRSKNKPSLQDGLSGEGNASEGDLEAAEDEDLAEGEMPIDLADEPAGPSLEATLAECGLTGVSQDPNAEVFNTSMRALPSVINGAEQILFFSIAYRLEVRVSNSFVASMTKATQKDDIQLMKYSPGLDLTRQRAEERLAPQRGMTTSISPDQAGRAALSGGSGPWKGAVCTLNPVTAMTTSYAGKTKTISFNPPIPSALWPRAKPSRYKTEINEGRNFENVVATVTASNDPAYPVGKTYTGSVMVTPVAGTLNETDPTNGSKFTVQADVAYKIRYDFGAATRGIGLRPSQSFYVDTETKAIKAVIVETGEKEIPRLVVAPNI